jgi:hypothetical protein
MLPIFSVNPKHRILFAGVLSLVGIFCHAQQPGNSSQALVGIDRDISDAMRELVDEGKLAWEKPVIEYLPSFRLYGPTAAKLTTMRDLLSHRTGMAPHDFLRISTHLSRDQLVDRLRYLRQISPSARVTSTTTSDTCLPVMLKAKLLAKVGKTSCVKSFSFL